MIELKQEFVSGDGGFSQEPLTYKQIKRTKLVAVYERSRNGKIKDYEVFYVRTNPKGMVQKFPGGVEKVLEDDTEKYPSTGVFGKIAWSINNLGYALVKFEELVKKSEIPEDDEETQEISINIPIGEFSTTTLAEANHIAYPKAFLFIKSSVLAKQIKLVREDKSGRGKPTKIYTKAWHLHKRPL